MRILISDSVDVYLHLAAEAYLLHEQSEDILMLWRSKDSVVCGKHQNACGEANYAYCFEHGINLARRLSGGGTVFHDLGNINFTFIQSLPGGMEKAVDYKRYLEPVRNVLLGLGISTTYSTRDDLLLNGLKISGNAQHIYQKGLKGLHHGTLLYDSNLKSLGSAIHSQGVYAGNGVPSNRSEVTNIRSWCDLGTSEDFLELLILHFEKYYGVKSTRLNAVELARCNEISQEKFATEDWILGYSPRYKHTRKLYWEDGVWDLDMDVYQNKIEQVAIRDTSGNLIWEDVLAQLIGKPLRLYLLQNLFPNREVKELLQLF
jgi:lipoate-protein ligase A